MEKPEESAPVQLIVEGTDDKYFLGALQTEMYKAGLLTDRGYIRKADGKYDPKKWRKMILKGIKARTKNDPITAIGLVCDADNDHAAALQRLQDVLKAVDLPVPKRAGEVTDTMPRIGILILPPKGGIREALCNEAWESIDTIEPVKSCIDEYMQCLHDALDGKVDTKGRSLFPHSEDKARLGTYLAAQHKPVFLIGIAIEKGAIPWDSPAFSEIRDFLTALIDGPS